MSIAPTMEVWQHAHTHSDNGLHHDAMRMFYAVEQNLNKEAEASKGNAKMEGICSKLLAQVTVEIKAYTELMEGNYYVALNVTRASSSSEVKKSYRKLALKHHPDRSKGDGCPGADRLFPLIQNAYEVLSDAVQKRKYSPTVHTQDCLRKVRSAGKSAQAAAARGSENSNPNAPSGGGRSTSNRSYQNRHKRGSDGGGRRSGDGGSGPSAGAGPPPSAKSYYEKYQQQQQERREEHARREEERRQQQQRGGHKYYRGTDSSSNEEEKSYKSAYQKEHDEYYYQKQRQWERQKAEEEKAAWKRRMEEIRKKRAEDEARKKRRDAEAQAEAERRRKARQERDQAWQEQQEEQARKDKLKKIVKLGELREMSGKEVKERLKLLGHAVQGLFEKEEFIKKYCVVTGQKYEAAVREAGNEQGRGNGGESDGSFFSFEKRVKEMGVKQLRQLIKERNGNLRGLVEKSELVDAALELYEGTSKLGRTMFGREAAAEEEKEKEKEKAQSEAPPSPPKRGGQPNISTEKMREYERKMRGGGGSSSTSKGSGGGGGEGQKTPPPTKRDEGVTLESVVKEYNIRMGRTAFGRAAFEDEKEQEQEGPQPTLQPSPLQSPQLSPQPSPQERAPTRPSTPPLTKEQMREMYDNMYKRSPDVEIDSEEKGAEQEEKVGEEKEEQGEGDEDNSGSPMADTKWEHTSRGKDFLVNGMKWDGGEENGVEEQTTSSEEGIEWQPGAEEQRLPDLFSHSVNLTEAEAKFIARQQHNLSEAEAAFIARQKNSPSRVVNGEDGGEDRDEDSGVEADEGDSRWNQEAFLRREDFSRTLPNWTVKEEVNFWLHGEGDDEYLSSEDEMTSDEDDTGSSGESELEDTDKDIEQEDLRWDGGGEEEQQQGAERKKEKGVMFWGHAGKKETS